MCRSGSKVTAHGAKLMVQALRRSRAPRFAELRCGFDLAEVDDALPALPDDVKRRNKGDGDNTAVMEYHRDRAWHRMHVRMTAVKVFHAAWSRGGGKPAATATPPTDAPATLRAAALAGTLHARRLCRTRGDAESVEPIGRAVVMYLGYYDLV